MDVLGPGEPGFCLTPVTPNNPVRMIRGSEGPCLSQDVLLRTVWLASVIICLLEGVPRLYNR